MKSIKKTNLIKKPVTIQKIDVTKDVTITTNKGTYVVPLSYYSLNPIKVDQIFDYQDFKDYLDEAHLFNCEEAFKKLLKQKDRTTQEIRKKLEENYEVEVVDNIINKYQKRGLLDDDRYIKEYLNQGIRKNRGLNRLIQELEQKGFKQTDIQSFISPRMLDEEVRKALILGKKTYMSKKDYRKVQYKLSYAGYDSDIINKVLRELGLDIQEN